MAGEHGRQWEVARCGRAQEGAASCSSWQVSHRKASGVAPLDRDAHKGARLDAVRAAVGIGSLDPEQKEATIAAWRKLLLDEILPHELQARRKKQLPKAAAPPQLRVRLAKTLGTANPDVLALEDASVFSVDRLLERAEAARLRREAAGISYSVEVRQPPRPTFDTQLVGKQLEICWPYKRDVKTTKIWASVVVKRVADGLTHKRTERCTTKHHPSSWRVAMGVGSGC